MIRQLANIMSAKGVTSTILFSKNGITSKAKQEIYYNALKNLKIFIVTLDDIKELKKNKNVLSFFLEKNDSFMKLIENDVSLLGI